MSNLLALLAACAFALGSVLQQKGTLETKAGENDPRFIAQAVRRPAWLAGAVSQMVGWILQAIALDLGSLIRVQALTSLNMVIALPLGSRLTHQRITRRVAIGALTMVAGIVVFISVGSPTGGTAVPSAAAWWSAGLGSLLLVTILAGLARRRSGTSRALLCGSAAGVALAFQAAVTKTFVPLVHLGLAAVLSSWTVYALVLSALVGMALQQTALKTGVLEPAIASSNVVTLLFGFVFGSRIFGESIAGDPARRTSAIIGLALSVVGIVLLAGAEPPAIEEIR
jgi:drug/metabolite transporter (DMT)-like permease